MEQARALIVLGASAALVGCFVDRSGTAPAGFDAAPPVRDGSPQDAGGFDAGPPDSDVTPARDAGPRDAGSPDTGRSDAGPPDAGVDAGPPILTVTTGLVHHYDAMDPEDDGSPPGAGSLSTWRTLHGSDDASCANVTYDPDGLRPGFPAVITTGDESSQCTFSIGDFDPGDLTIAVVLRTDDGRSDANWFNSPVIVGGDKNGDHDDAAMIMNGGSVGFARRSGGQQFLGSEHGRAGFDDDAPHVFVLARADGGEVRLAVDRAGEVVGSAEGGRINQPSSWYLASHEGSGGAFRARYAEVLVYERTLTPGEVDDVRRYLLARWGF